MLKSRAELYSQIRAFFCARQVIEVETPLLSVSTATDPQLESVTANLSTGFGQPSQPYFLHTSPEFPMKRLLAAGSGAIYQICKTFRNGESSPRHNPEFSMLEWYRPGFSLQQLMTDVTELISTVLAPVEITRLSYQNAFRHYLEIDPFDIDDISLAKLATSLTDYQGPEMARDDYLNLLLCVCIEPHLGADKDGQLNPIFLYDYPPSQASLANVYQNEGGIKVAQRFELYIRGLELANGYYELTDEAEHRRRFKEDNDAREEQSLPMIPVDQNFLAALEVGLPNCSGVALGLDRLLMVKENAKTIADVLAFPIDRA